MNFNLKKPCKNCPFLAEGAIQLERGRLAGIVNQLKSDYDVFQCHKTVHHSRGGQWNEDTGRYTPSGNESACMGALAYMYRMNYLPILARFALMREEITKQDILDVYPLIIPEDREL